MTHLHRLVAGRSSVPYLALSIRTCSSKPMQLSSQGHLDVIERRLVSLFEVHTVYELSYH